MQGCAEFTQPLRPAGGPNVSRLDQFPSGPETIRALFDASVPERLADFREYDAAYNRVWAATLKAVKTLGNPILNASRENGVITTDYLERRGFPATKPWRDRYQVSVSKLSDAKMRVTVKRIVEEQERLERMRGGAGITWREAAGLEWTKKQSNGNYEGYLLTAVEKAIQR